jgi:large subunit ribosomal protein L30
MGAKPTSPKKIEVKLVRSMIGSTERQINTLRSLGLRRVGASRVHTINPQIEGMLIKVAHLVSIKEVADAQNAPKDAVKSAPDDASSGE